MFMNNGGFLELLRCDAIAAKVGPQDFRNEHAAIGLLIVLDDRNPRPSDCQPAAIERVHQLRFLAAFRAITDVRASRLKIREVRARGNLAEETLSRQPYFDVIGLRRRKTQVGGAERHRAIVQAEFLQYGLGIARQLLVLLPRLLRLGELHQFDLLKLVLADNEIGRAAGWE